MRSVLSLILLSALLVPLAHASTWYVRVDGGTRYSANMPTGQCDGLADAAYPGAGVNQHCAFSDYRYLWDDQSYGNHAWVIAGGDTVIVDNTKQWRVGFDGNGSSTDPWCYGFDGGPYGCSNPNIPPGTPAQPTRILGRNYASCSSGNTSNRSAMTQIFGGHGVGAALNLTGAQNVQVECIEITRHSDCMTHGYPAYPSSCNTNEGPSLDDYDSEGITEDQGTANVLLQDLWIHGHTDRGILGPIGGQVTANRVNVSYNGNSGWDFDSSSGANDKSVNGSLALHYVTIEWNGCNQEYPAVDTYPAISCYSQSTGGYGDGIGTPSGMAMNVEIDHSIFRYNTQDGEDFGHIDTGSSTLSITDSYSYGNNGAQFKWGPAFSTVVFENNLVIGNCFRMSQPIDGAPSTYNVHLQDFCRAGSTISFNFNNGETALFANNTIVNYAPSTFDFHCDSARCRSTSMTLTNNIIFGYDNPATYNMGGGAGGPGLYCGPSCNGYTNLLGAINRYSNSYYGIRGSCQAGVATESLSGVISGETCQDPLLVHELPSFTTEPALDNYNFNLSSGSPDMQAGIPVAGLTTDYNSDPWPAPPSLGAIEYGDSNRSATVTNLTVTGTGNPFFSQLTVIVTPSAAAAGPPTGTLGLSVDGLLITTLPLNPSGAATLFFPSWVTAFGISAAYSGDINYLPSTGALGTQSPGTQTTDSLATQITGTLITQ